MSQSFVRSYIKIGVMYGGQREHVETRGRSAAAAVVQGELVGMHGLRHSGGRSSRGAQQLEQAREAQCGQEQGGRGLINQLFSRHANRAATDAPRYDVAQGLLCGRHAASAIAY